MKLATAVILILCLSACEIPVSVPDGVVQNPKYPANKIQYFKVCIEGNEFIATQVQSGKEALALAGPTGRCKEITSR